VLHPEIRYYVLSKTRGSVNL